MAYRRVRFVSVTEVSEGQYLVELPGGVSLRLSEDALRVWFATSADALVEPAEVHRELPAPLARAASVADVADALEALRASRLVETTDDAAGYDRIAVEFDRRPGYSGRFLDFIRAQSDAAHLRAVVEVGCGTGFALDRLVELGAASLQGVDVSRAMLSLARARLARHQPPIALHHARGEALPFDERTISMIVLMGTLNSLDPARFWAEAARVLKREHRVFVLHRSIAPGRKNPVSEVIAHRLNDWQRKALGLDLAGMPREVRIWRVEHLDDEIVFESAAQLRAYLHTQAAYDAARMPADAQRGPALDDVPGLLSYPARIPCLMSAAALECSL